MSFSPRSGVARVCVLPSHLFWTSGLWTYQPESHRRKVTHDLSIFLLREEFSRSFPSSTGKSNNVYQVLTSEIVVLHLFCHFFFFFIVRKNPSSSVPTIEGGGDTTIPSPGMARKQPLPGIELHDPPHGRQACPESNSFHQGVCQISPPEGLFLCRPLSKRGQICYIPTPPPKSLNDSFV